MRKISPDELDQLIRENSFESVHVDFKREWHQDNASLIHDILCLSNADYDGPRFLLLGVSNNSEITGLKDDLNRKNNHQLIDLLRANNFNRLPDIDVYTLDTQCGQVDVIQIANKADKPYFLTKDYRSQGKIVRASAVYSRNGSSNTPIDSGAKEIEVEKMWRERFGLDKSLADKSPVVRVKKFLSDVSNWVCDESGDTYVPFPEFTIETQCSDLDSDQEWTRGEIGYRYAPGNSAAETSMFYHQTCISKVQLVRFDGGKKCMVAPEWVAVSGGRFYYYLEDSVDFAYRTYLRTRQGMADEFDRLRFPIECGSARTYEIPIFRSKSELGTFLNFQGAETSESATDNSEQNKLWYEAYMKYERWRESNPRTRNSFRL